MLWSTAFLIDWLNGRVCHCAGKWGNELVSDRFAMLKKPQFYKKNTMKHVQLKAKVFPYFQVLLKTLERLPILISLYIVLQQFLLIKRWTCRMFFLSSFWRLYQFFYFLSTGVLRDEAPDRTNTPSNPVSGMKHDSKWNVEMIKLFLDSNVNRIYFFILNVFNADYLLLSRSCSQWHSNR